MSHDIDWFCRLGDTYIHAASFGGAIPPKVNDRKKLVDILLSVYQLPIIHKDIYLNIGYLHRLGLTEKSVNWNNYIKSFVFFAKRGFYSFDRMYTYEEESTDFRDKTQYTIIAYPANYKQISINNIPSYPDNNNIRSSLNLPMDIFSTKYTLIKNTS